MNRPPLEVADLIRMAGQKFIESSRSWLTAQHRKVLAAIERCRTAALGGHRDACSRCGYRAISYNSCRNRHCPKCQAQARDRWLEARRQELLPTRYVHVVFTLPHLLAPLALQNKKVLYDLLLRASAQTLLEVARHPRHLGAEIGFFSVLHTWNQKLEHHPHVHCVVPAGALSPDHRRWRDSAHGNQQRLMTLSVDEFLRRFLLHVLPPGFVRIRHFGFLAHRRRARLLPLCFQLLRSATNPTPAQPFAPESGKGPAATPPPTSPWTCPQCGGPMIILERLSAAPIARRSPPLPLARNS